VLNPTAGKGKATGSWPHLRANFEAQGHRVVDLSAPDLAGATASARQAVVDGLDALVVAGGDGMVHLGVNLVAGTSLPLGIIALGTGNDVARSLGLPRSSAKAGADAVCQALAQPPYRVDAVEVSTPHHSMSEWFCGVLSAGFDAAVNAKANALAWPRGESVYVRALFAELRRYQPYGFDVELDGRPCWSGPAALVAVANGLYFGGGMKLAPQAVMDDGLIDLMVAGPLTKAQLLRVFPRIYGGSHLSHPAVNLFTGKSVTIRPRADLGANPPDAHTDGERVGPLPLTCTVVPGAVRILRPVRLTQNAPR